MVRDKMREKWGFVVKALLETTPGHIALGLILGAILATGAWRGLLRLPDAQAAAGPCGECPSIRRLEDKNIGVELRVAALEKSFEKIDGKLDRLLENRARVAFRPGAQ